jgi:hypothetical protein
MNTTPNINLSTYTSNPNDKFNLMVTFNENMNKIDTAVGEQNQQINLIGETASTAVSTANTASTTAINASTTATEALDVANSKPSINDTVAGATSTYSSNKIDDLISGIQPGSEIDDSVTSTTKTWSSSKINTQINTKASINDTTASATTTYSSNKISNSYAKLIDIFNSTSESLTVTSSYSSNLVSYITSDKTIETDGYYQIRLDNFMTGSAINNASLRLGIYITYNNKTFEQNNHYNLNINNGRFSYYSPILYLKAGAKIAFTGGAFNQTSTSSAPSITSVYLTKYDTLN